MAKGTLMKVVEIDDPVNKRYFWLNNSDVPINSVSFSFDGQFVAVNEKKGVIHYIRLETQENDNGGRKTGFFGKLLKERAFSKLEAEITNSFTVFDERSKFLYNFNSKHSIGMYEIDRENSSIVEMKVITLNLNTN